MSANNQVAVTFQNVNGFVFNPMSLVAVDFQKYEAGKPGRAVEFHFVGPVLKRMVDSAADAAYKWYVDSTGASPLPSGLRAPGRAQ